MPGRGISRYGREIRDREFSIRINLVFPVTNDTNKNKSLQISYRVDVLLKSILSFRKGENKPSGVQVISLSPKYKRERTTKYENDLRNRVRPSSTEGDDTC